MVAMGTDYDYKVQLIQDNYSDLRKSFKWDADLTKHLIALNHGIKGKRVDKDSIEDLKSYIKSETGAFSPFRGNMLFTIAGLMASNDGDQRSRLDRMMANLDMLKSVGFKSGMYLPTALYALEMMGVEDERHVVQQAFDLYKDIRKNHPFLTGGDDYALAILLANSDHGANKVELYYKALAERGFRKGNGLQMMSHIASFAATDVTEKCGIIYDKMKNSGLKISSEYYPAVALIGLLDGDTDRLTDDLIEVALYLKGQKHYKWLGKGMNILMASAVITSEYVESQSHDQVMSTALAVSIEAILAAQQAAMIAGITASSAAAAAAN